MTDTDTSTTTGTPTGDADTVPSLAGDRTGALLRQGYAFGPRLRRRAGADAVEFRLMGRRTVLVEGPEGARLFYDGARFRRAGAIPRPLQRTLFGDGPVHVLDDEEHRV